MDDAAPPEHGAAAPEADPPGGTSFAEGVAPWLAQLGSQREVVRQALVARHLAAHLPPPVHADGVRTRVLDAGCGQGTQVVHLARAGYAVVGIDLSPELLDHASSAVASLTAEEQARVTLGPGDVLDPAPATAMIAPDGFDAVCCHGVVMYLPALADVVASLASVLRPGGVLSVVSRNRASIAMRAGMTGDWTGALAGFDARHYGNRLGIPHCRADEPGEVATAFDAAGVSVDAWYGVRVFTDHLDGAPPTDADALASLIAAEDEAGRRDPYRQLASLTHTLGTRR